MSYKLFDHTSKCDLHTTNIFKCGDYMEIGESLHNDLIVICECADSFFWKDSYNNLDYPEEMAFLVKEIQRYSSFSIYQIHDFCNEMGILRRHYTDLKYQGWIVLDTQKIIDWFNGKSHYQILDRSTEFNNFVFLLNTMIIRRIAGMGSYKKGLAHLEEVAEYYKTSVSKILIAIYEYRESHFNNQLNSLSEIDVMYEIGMIS
jgi:hypothetical protein